MRSLRFLIPVLGLASMSLFAAACSDDGSTDGEGGAGGEATTPSDGGEVGSGGSGDIGAGGGCAETGTGTLVIEVDGLPGDVSPSIYISGPRSHRGGTDARSRTVERQVRRTTVSPART